MSNTTIQLRKSGQTGNTPGDLAHGELAINYADGKLFYKNGVGIKFITNQDTFSTVNVQGNLILASGTTDILSFAAGDNIVLTPNVISKTITISVPGGSSIDSYAREVSQAAFDKANATNTYATSAYDQANSTNILAQAAFDKANTGSSADQFARDTANAAFSQANAANNMAIGAYNLANTNASDILVIQGVDVGQNNRMSIIEGVDLTQNTNITAADTLARGAFDQANATNGYATSAYGQANAANNLAQSAYNTANTGYNFVTSGGTISGNVTIQNDLSVLGNVNFVGNVTSIQVTGNSGQFFGYASNGHNALYAGIPVGYDFQPFTIFQASANHDGYSQINIQNINGGTDASSDLVATADNGNENDTYINMGIGSSNHSDPDYTLVGPNDGYLYVSGNTVTGGGDLVVGTFLPQNDLVFAAGGMNTENEQMRIIGSSNTIVFKSNVSSTSVDSGALKVSGGIGVLGTVWASQVVSNNVNLYNLSTTIFNSSNAVNNHANSAYAQANAANNMAVGAYNLANTNSNQITAIQGVDDTQNTRITISEGVDAGQNTRITISEGVDAGQNTRMTIIEGVDTGQNTRMTIIEGVDVGQNTRANAINTYAFSAYAHANAAFNAANSVSGVAKTGDVMTGQLNVAAGIVTTNTRGGSIITNGDVGIQGNVFVGKAVSFANNNTGISAVAYIQYNATAGSLDFIFG